MSEQPSPLTPGTYDIPHSREGLSKLETAKARWGVAEIFTNEQPEFEVQQVTRRTHLREVSAETTNLRLKRLDSVISLHDEDSSSIQSPANIFRKALSLLTGEMSVVSHFTKGTTERELIQLESEIGSQLFGPIPAGNRREFFNLDATTWIWHEEWTDVETGKPAQLTTRYEVHDNGVLKVQEGAQYSFLEGEELVNLSNAASLYYTQVAKEIYYQEPGSIAA